MPETVEGAMARIEAERAGGLEGSGAGDGVQTTQVPSNETATQQQGTEGGEKDAPTWDYVKELRAEAAQHRTRAKKYEEAFSAYTEEEQEVLLDIARQLADPTLQPQAAQRLQRIAEGILGGGGDEGTPRTPKRPTGEEDPDQRPLTVAEWRAEQQRIQEEQEQARAIADLEQTARGLGYQPGSDDYFFWLSKLQLPDVAGDPQKAHEKVEEYWAEKAQQRAQRVQERAGRWPGAPGTAADVPSIPDGETIKTVKDASRMTRAWFNARAGQA